MNWKEYNTETNFESGKNWSMSRSARKDGGNAYYTIQGYNYNTGPQTIISGVGYTEKEAWEAVVKDCQERIDWIKQIQKEAQEQINNIKGL